MGFSLSKITKQIGNSLSSGAKSVLNAPLSAVEQVATSAGTSVGSILAPAAQSGALGQLTSGAVSGFTGSPGALLGGSASDGSFDFTSRLLGNLFGASPASLGQSSVAGSAAPAEPTAAVPWYQRPAMLALVIGGVLAVIVAAVLVFRRKGRA